MSQYRSPFRGVLKRPPAIGGGSEGEGVRHATWLELFFDLVFVVAIAELGGYLHHHLTLSDVLGFAGLFLLVWWVWLGYSYYADLFDTEDLLSRLMMIAAMFLVIFLAQTADDALNGESFAFGVAILLLRAIVTLFYYRAQHIEGPEKRFVQYFTISNVFTTGILALALFVPEPGRFGLWGAAVIISLGGAAVIYTATGDVVEQASHLPERLGLFTIIVLGETILAVSFGTSITDPGPETLTIGALGFLVAVSMWWLYFRYFDEALIDRILHPTSEHWLNARQRGLVYTFSHYLTHMGIVAGGIGIIILLESSLTGVAPEPGGVGVVGGGVALYLIGTSLCHRAIPDSIDGNVFRIRLLVAAGLFLYPGLGIQLSPIVSLVLVSGLLLAVIALDFLSPGVAAPQLETEVRH
ncbi:low temperature requirement protein A [Haloferax sp. CBA1149]|uniref:low temperature requirement protein A n=1 Tax=Haloferax sp. CBA1149 TaxID=2650753 RepID=UPI00177E0434|nr:low temperature requirement protein A [Haloferax sp. CBA1149]